MKKLITLLAFTALAVAGEFKGIVSWQYKNISTLAALGLPIPPGTKDHVMVSITWPDGTPENTAVLVELTWDSLVPDEAQETRWQFAVVNSAGAVITFDVPAGRRPKPARIRLAQFTRGPETEVIP